MIGGITLSGIEIIAPVLLTPIQERFLVGGSFIIGGLFAIAFGFRKLKEAQIIQDTPTEEIESAAAGRTKVNGIARLLGDPIQRPFGDEDCIATAYEIEERQTRETEDGEEEKWETISEDLFIKPFQLDDGTGTIRVDADGVRPKFGDEYTREIYVAEQDEPPSEVIEFVKKHKNIDLSGSGGITGSIFSEPRRYTEYWIPVEEELYVLGGAEPVEPDDTNTCGLAMREDDASGMFLISPMSESELVAGGKLKAVLFIVAGVAFNAIGLYLPLSQLGL